MLVRRALAHITFPPWHSTIFQLSVAVGYGRKVTKYKENSKTCNDGLFQGLKLLVTHLMQYDLNYAYNYAGHPFNAVYSDDGFRSDCRNVSQHQQQSFSGLHYKPGRSLKPQRSIAWEYRNLPRDSRSFSGPNHAE